jgi:hypothetical protein
MRTGTAGLMLVCLAGCGTTSTVHGMTGVGQFGDRILVRRTSTTLVSSPWTGAGMSESEEFALCKLDENSQVRCEKATVSLPASSGQATSH